MVSHNASMITLNTTSRLSDIRKAIRSGSNLTKSGAAYFVDGQKIGTGHGAKIAREIKSAKIVRI